MAYTRDVENYRLYQICPLVIIMMIIILIVVVIIVIMLIELIRRYEWDSILTCHHGNHLVHTWNLSRYCIGSHSLKPKGHTPLVLLLLFVLLFVLLFLVYYRVVVSVLVVIMPFLVLIMGTLKYSIFNQDSARR